MLQQLNDTSAGGPSANDDTWPPGAVDLNRAADLHITRDHYLEAESRGLSLSELLEADAYDPTPAGSPLDAFERQLAVHGIRTGRARSSTVELFYSQAPALLPEFMRREIQRGQSMRPEIARLVASTSNVSANRYTPFHIDADPTHTKLSLRPMGDGAEVPQLAVTEQTHSLPIQDYGLALKVSYKALRYRTTAQFKVLLWYIGYRLAADRLAMIVDVLQNGDGNGNPATVINTAASGAVTYDDLIELWSRFDPFEMNTILCHQSKIKALLTLDEFKDPAAGFAFQSSGRLVNPLGSSMVRADAVPQDLIIGLDRRFALEEVVSQPLTIEYDKIIEQRFEEAVISESIAYAKVVPQACVVLDTVWT
jgi:hypothetical protein